MTDVPISGRVHEDIARWIDEEDITVSKKTRELWTAYYEHGAIQAAAGEASMDWIDDVDRELAELEDFIGSVRDELAERRQEIAESNPNVDARAPGVAESYDDALQRISGIARNLRTTDNEAIQKVADDHGKPADTVIDDLNDRHPTLRKARTAQTATEGR